MRRKGLILFFVLLCICLSVSAETNKTIITTFTANKSCFAGFSKKNVTNVIQLADTEIYQTGSKVMLNVDPVNGYWYSPLVYVYCQAFSPVGLELFVYAPDKMTDGVYDESIDYSVVQYEGYIWEKASVNGQVMDYYHFKEADGTYTVPRVALSLPLKIKVDNKNVKANRNYGVTFTLKVNAK